MDVVLNEKSKEEESVKVSNKEERLVEECVSLCLSYFFFCSCLCVCVSLLLRVFPCLFLACSFTVCVQSRKYERRE